MPLWDSSLIHSDPSPKASSAKGFHGSHGLEESGRDNTGTRRKSAGPGKDAKLTDMAGFVLHKIDSRQFGNSGSWTRMGLGREVLPGAK